MNQFINFLGNVTSAHIRNVIAFPKNSSGKCRMTRSPSTIPANVLKRYALKIDEKIIEKTKPNAEEWMERFLCTFINSNEYDDGTGYNKKKLLQYWNLWQTENVW